jgi:hypothetical protein
MMMKKCVWKNIDTLKIARRYGRHGARFGF